MKHTPGPWEIKTLKSSSGFYVFTKGQKNWPNDHIATCGNEANARLIAAAPDLLEALNKIVISISPQYIPYGLLEEAKQAIAETEGYK